MITKFCGRLECVRDFGGECLVQHSTFSFSFGPEHPLNDYMLVKYGEAIRRWEEMGRPVGQKFDHKTPSPDSVVFNEHVTPSGDRWRWVMESVHEFASYDEYWDHNH